MSILKYKYKVHKFINYAFYIVVFIFGFLLGFSTEKIDFNKLISQVLMIDNVSAYEIPETNVINEEYIYNIFSENENFNLDDFPYIRCSKNNSSSEIHCYAYKKEYLDSISSITKYTTSNSNNYRFVVTTSLTYADSYFIWFTINNINSDDITYTRPFLATSSTYITSANDYQATTNTTYYGTWTNFNFPTNLEYSDVLNTYNVLDFSVINLEFNENLFKDNSDFKEVCVDKGKKYSITTTNIDPITNSIFVSDFIWFPGKVTGVKYSEYDSLADDNILVFNDDVSTENYYFKDKEKIDSIFNDELISNYFIHSGYTDKYSLYGYTAYKFIHSYYVDDDNNSQNMFTIFDFTDMNFSSFGSVGGSSGSFGDTPLTYCFYIKNEFNVTELQTNEWDDYVGTVPTPGGDLDVITSHNKNNISYKVDSFFSTINNVISELRPTINFIKQHIEQLYLSMPLIVRSFIISFLVLIVIRILIGMVVK